MKLLALLGSVTADNNDNSSTPESRLAHQ